MARFYGTVQGQRGEASRLGHASSGLQVTAACWGGAVHVQMFVDSNDRDCVEVSAGPWHGSGPSGVFYRGPVEDMFKKGKRDWRA